MYDTLRDDVLRDDAVRVKAHKIFLQLASIDAGESVMIPDKYRVEMGSNKTNVLYIKQDGTWARGDVRNISSRRISSDRRVFAGIARRTTKGKN